jgi:hypothetical protein
MASAAIPVGISIAKVTGPPLVLGAVFGAVSYYFDQFLAENKWLVTILGAFAGVGLGMFLVFR